MPSISSLLKSAQATQKKVKSQEDAYIAYQWENSAQTYEDFVEYSKYLDERIKTANDPSDALSYQTKLRSANRSFTSNEIQRQQMNIMEGRGDTTTKMEAIQNLWERAIQADDFNLAQNLMSQWDSLSIKLQNEQEAAVKAMAASGGKAFDDLTKSLTKGSDDVTLPNGQVVTPLAALERNFNDTGDTVANMKAAQETMDAIRATVIDQYNNATTQDERDKLEDKYGPQLVDIDSNLTFNIGGKKLTAQDVVNAVANDEFNNPIYGLKATRNEVTGRNEFKLEENNVEKLDYARQVDPTTGQEYYAPISVRTDQNDLFFGTSDQGRGLNTQITGEGSIIGGSVNGDSKQGNINMGSSQVKRDDSQSIGNRLKDLGIIARQNGTTLKIKLPGEGVEREATIQPDGSIRYYADNGELVEFGLTKRNLGTNSAPMVYEAGQQRVVDPDEVSDFSKASKFGGNISQASAQGKRYTQSITGQARVNTLIPGNSGISVSNNFAGYGGPATSGAFQGTSALLQGSAATRKGIEQEKQRLALQARTEALQASANQFDLNQTPVQQLARNGVLKQQLSVAAPQAPRRVYVAQLPYTPIKSVGVAPRTQNITGVSVAGPQPRIRI
jgi:hypothetical protein